MRSLTVLCMALLTVAAAACGSGIGVNNATPSPNSSENKASMPMPMPSSTPKNGEYPGKGKVTKINTDLGSVEIDHEAIKDVMPAMKMEFKVSERAMLKTIAVGDIVDFTLEYKDRSETIVKIEKAK